MPKFNYILFLIGLVILLISGFIKYRKKNKETIPLLIVTFLVPIIITSLLSIYLLPLGIILLGGLIYLYWNSNYDYDEEINSIKGSLRKFEKPDEDSIIVGNIVPTNKYELKYNKSPIRLTDEILRSGTMITGSTGSGKTTTMVSLMHQAIDRGQPVVFCDYKGDVEILDKLEEIAKERNIPYYEFSTRGSNFFYDPLVNLNTTGRVEALMNTRRWDSGGADEHYKTSTQLAIQSLITAYDKYREEKKDDRNYIIGLHEFAMAYRPKSNERDGHATLIKQLEILITSRAQELFKRDKKRFSFETEEQFIVCFSFVSANKALANSLSSFIYQDLMDRSIRKRFEPNLLLCIDEFGTLESSTLIKDILEKGRQGGCQTVFSILDVNQISMSAGEYFVQAILGTINNFIIHAGATQKTAELLAGVQRFNNKDIDIMKLKKPYKNKKPTALFITKYPVIKANGTQEVYRIVPYIYTRKGIKVDKVEVDKEEIEAPEIKDTTLEEKHDVQLIEPEQEEVYVENIDDFL